MSTISWIFLSKHCFLYYVTRIIFKKNKLWVCMWYVCVCTPMDMCSHLCSTGIYPVAFSFSISNPVRSCNSHFRYLEKSRTRPSFSWRNEKWKQSSLYENNAGSFKRNQDMKIYNTQNSNLSRVDFCYWLVYTDICMDIHIQKSHSSG